MESLSLKLFMMRNTSANSYGLVLAKNEVHARFLLESYLHVCWDMCGEVSLPTGEAVLAEISYPGSIAQLTAPEKPKGVPAKAIVIDDFVPSSSWGECHCACHSSGGHIEHCTPCCGECTICGRKITGNMEAHILDYHQKRVHTKQT